MKFRCCFVSNSSSSSFIIHLDKPIEDYKTFMDFAKDNDIRPTDYEFGKTLYKDLKQYELPEIEDSEIYVEIYSNRLPPSEIEEIEKQSKQYILDLIRKRCEERKNNAQYILEYADDSGAFYSSMEHHFMPNFKGTVEIISHH